MVDEIAVCANFFWGGGGGGGWGGQSERDNNGELQGRRIMRNETTDFWFICWGNYRGLMEEIWGSLTFCLKWGFPLPMKALFATIQIRQFWFLISGSFLDLPFLLFPSHFFPKYLMPYKCSPSGFSSFFFPLNLI